MEKGSPEGFVAFRYIQLPTTTGKLLTDIWRLYTSLRGEQCWVQSHWRWRLQEEIQAWCFSSSTFCTTFLSSQFILRKRAANMVCEALIIAKTMVSLQCHPKPSFLPLPRMWVYIHLHYTWRSHLRRETTPAGQNASKCLVNWVVSAKKTSVSFSMRQTYL